MAQSIPPCAQIPTQPIRAQTLVGHKLQRPSPIFPVTFLRQLRLQRFNSPPFAALMNSPNGVALAPKGGKGISKLEIELQVRDYELDQYGVVNNAVYSNYCQLGHHKLMESVGVSPDDIVKTGEALALYEISLKFLAPLKSGDRFVLKVRILELSAIRIHIEHLIFKLPNQQPIMEAKCTGVWVGKNYRPVRFPSDVKSKLMQLMRDEETT